MSRFVGPDGAEMRNFILSQLDWDEVDRVLDVGCGVGYDLYGIAERVPKRSSQPGDVNAAQIFGIDVRQEDIEFAQANPRKNERFDFRVHDFAEKLPFPDNYFDVVFSHNVLECSTDKSGLLSELHRILKPGGKILCAHFDWDSALFNGSDKDLIRKITHAYADWKQDWMDACEGWMGRKLWGTFQSTNLFADAKLVTYQIVNTIYQFPYYGFKSVQGYGEMVSKGLISADEYRSFVDDMETLAAKGDYLFCITTFIYSARK